MSSRNQKFYFIPVGQETNPNYQADLDISLAYVSGTTKFLGAVTGVSSLNVSGGSFLQGSATVLSNLNVSGVVTIGNAPLDTSIALTVNNQMKFIEYGASSTNTTTFTTITNNNYVSQADVLIATIPIPSGFVTGSSIFISMTGNRDPNYGYIEGGSYINDSTNAVRLVTSTYGAAGTSGAVTINSTGMTVITSDMFPLNVYKYAAYPGWSVSNMALNITINYTKSTMGVSSSFQQIASQGSYALVDNMNSTPRLFINESGKVGIGGITAPYTFLHVTGQNNNAIALFQANTNTGVNDAGIILGSISGTTPFISDNASAASAGLTFRTNNVERMRIDSTGKLGLGVSAPAANMHISGSSLFNGPITGYSTLNISGVTSMMGNVGIGTTNPGVPLQVNGNVCINRSKLTFSGTPNDFNHAIFNNYTNIDGEGSIDGIKINAYSCFWVRVGTAAGTVPTTAMYINSSGQMGIGTTNTEGNMLKVDGGNNTSGISLGNFDTTGIKYIGITPTTSMPNNLGTNSGFSGITFGPPNPGSSTSGYLAFHTHYYGASSAERMRIDKSGNVGIGTNAPVTTFHVNGNSYLSGAVTNGSTLNVLSTGYFGGNLGIGTTSPGQPLSIQMAPSSEGGAGAIVLQDTSAINRLRIGFNSNYSWIQAHNSQPLIINSVGNNVGVGITNPSAFLHVNGTSIITGAMTAGSTLRVIGTTTIPELQMSGISGPAGFSTEGTNVLNMNLNFRPLGSIITANVGGAFRIDGSNAPLYQWLYRAAGSSSEGGIMTLNSSGNMALGTGLSGSAPTMLYVSGTSAFNSNSTFNSTLYVGSNMTANSSLAVNGNLNVLTVPINYSFSAGNGGTATNGGGGGAGGIVVQQNGTPITPTTVATAGTNGSTTNGATGGTGFGAGGGGGGTSSGSTTTISGDWYQTQYPSSFILSSYQIGARYDLGTNSSIGQNRTARNFSVVGSNDGTTWSLLDTQTNQNAWYNGSLNSFTVLNNTTAYSYYRFIISQTNSQPYPLIDLANINLYAGTSRWPPVQITNATWSSGASSSTGSISGQSYGNGSYVLSTSAQGGNVSLLYANILGLTTPDTGNRSITELVGLVFSYNTSGGYTGSNSLSIPITLASGVGANGFVYIYINGTEYFTQASTSYTFTSAGSAKIIIMGGGGNGGTSSTNSGGGAGYIQTYTIAVTSSMVATITIGGSSSVVIGGTTYSANVGATGSAYGGAGSSSGGNIGMNGMNNGNTASNTTSQGSSVVSSALSFVQSSTILSASSSGVTASSLLLTSSLNTIGNITGQSNLNISGNTSLMGNVAINNTTAATAFTIYKSGVGFRQTDGTVALDIYTGVDNSLTLGKIGTFTNNPLGFYTNNNSAQMMLDTTGNFGINTTPAAKLHVNGTSILGGAITTTSTLTVANAITALSTVNISGQTVINGMVGIGTNPTSAALHINNNVLRMGTLYEQVSTNFPEQIQWGNFSNMGYSNITAGMNGNTGPNGLGGIMNLVTKVGNAASWNGIYMNNGNVGVGISSPSTMFHVNGNSLLQGATSVTSTLNVASTTIIGGNMGIGTTNPQTTLDINNSINPKIYLTNSGSRAFLSGISGALDFGNDAGTNSVIRFMPNGSESIRIANNGSMGIGTTAPTASLHVSGNAIIQTATTVGSTLNVSGATILNSAMTASSSLNVVGNLRVSNIYPYVDTITSGSTLNETINIVGHYINIGNANSIISILGTTTSVFTNEIMLEDPLIIVNSKSSSIYNTNGNDAGIQIDAISSVGYIKTNVDGTKFTIKAPQSTDIGYIVTKDNNDNVTITGTTIMKGASTHLSTLNISGTTIINNNLAVGRSSARYTADIVGMTQYPFTGAASQVIISDSVGSGLMNLSLGTNGTNNYAAIQSSLSGTGPMPISINPSGGNVSIGMTAGSSILQVNQAFSGSSTLLEGPDLALSTNNPSNTYWKLGSITGYVAAGAANDTSNYPGGLLFKTKVQDGSNTSALVSRMALDSRGYLGVGTLAPNTMLHVSGASTLNGPVTVTSTLNVSGNTVLAGTLLLNNNPVMVHKELGAAPSNPNLGDEWYNTSTSVLYKYINSQWVAAPVSTPTISTYRNFTGSETIINYNNQIFFNWTAPVSCNITSLTIQASGALNNGGFIIASISINGNQVFSQAYTINSLTDNVISMNGWTSTNIAAGQVLSIQWTTLNASRYFQIRSNATSDLPVVFSYAVNMGYVNMFGLSVTGTTLLQNAATTVSTLNVSGASVFNSSINVPNMTASTVLITDANKNIVPSNISTTTLGYLDATSSIQTQINSLSTNASSGAQTITGLKTYQSMSNDTPNIVFSGLSLNNTNDNNNGIGLELYNNTAGNRQLAMIDSAISRSGTAYSVLRFAVGYNIGGASIDAVSSDGNTTQKQLSLGNVGGGVYMQGNVGIGTSSPAYTLDVAGSIRSQSTMYVGNGSGAGILNLWDIPGAAWQFNTAGNNLTFSNGTIGGSLTNRFTLTQAGNMGIGTVNPSALLYLNSNTADRTTSLVVNTMRAGIVLNSTGSGGSNYNIWSTLTGETPGAGALAFYDNTNSAFRMVINSSGNIGIGNSTPQFNLHVGTDASPGTIATKTIRLQPGYNAGGQYGFNISAVDNGVDGHNMVFTSRAGPTDAFYEVARLTNRGLMGIGTTAPGAMLHVSGNTIITNGATILSSLNVSGSTTITNGATVISTLNVSGNTTITGTLTVNNYPMVVHKELGTSPSGPNLGDEHYNTSTSMLSKYMANNWYTIPFIKGKLYSFSAGAGGAFGTVSGGATYSGGGGAGGIVVQQNGTTVAPTTVATAGTGGSTGNGGSAGVGFGAGGGGSGTSSGSTATISGDWYQTQYPTAFVLTSYQIGARYNLGTNSSIGQNRTARNFSVVGSNDGSNWNLVDTQTNQNAWYNGSLNTFNVSNNTTAYSYYRFIISQTNSQPYPLIDLANINLYAGTSMWPPVQITNATWSSGASSSTGSISGQSYGNGSYVLSTSAQGGNVSLLYANILGLTTPDTGNRSITELVGFTFSYNTSGSYTGSNSLSVPITLASGVGANGFVYMFSDYEEYFTQSSGTYTVNFPGIFKVLIMGGGGSGGVDSMRGGGGAGFIQTYKIELIKGTVVTITVGTSNTNTSAVINNITYTASAGASGSTNANGGAGSSSGGGSNTASSGATSGFSGGNSNSNTTSQGTSVFNTLVSTVMTDSMTTNYLGQVGIGTPLPAATLHVSGNSIISGASTMLSSLFIASALTTLSSLNISGNTTMNGPVTTLSSINISGNSTIVGNMNISGTTSMIGRVAINNSTAQTAFTIYQSGTGFRQTDGNVSLDMFTGADGSITAGEIGTSTNNPLGFYTNNNSAQMILDTTGYLGISTTAPAAALHVSGTSIIEGASTHNSTLRVGGTSILSTTGIGTSNPVGALTVALSDAGSNIGQGLWNSKYLLVTNDTSGSTSAAGMGFSYSSSKGGIISAAIPGSVFTNMNYIANAHFISCGGSNTQVLTVAANGNVGIGTTGPSSLLHVAGNSLLGGTVVATGAFTTNSTLYVAGASIFGSTTVFNGAVTSNSSLTMTTGQVLRVNASSAATSTSYFSMGGNGEFQVDAPSVAGGRMIIKDAGNVGINNSAPTYKLDVGGDIRSSGTLMIGSGGGGSSAGGAIYSDGNWGMLLRAKTAAPAIAEFLLTNAADTHRMVISTAGSMGVGTDTPNSYYRIHAVQSSNDCVITSECTNSTQYAYFCAKANGTVGYFGQTNAGNSFIMNGSTTIMTFSSGANVGIGTTAPTSKLHLYTTSINPDQFTLNNSSGMQLAIWGSASCLSFDTYNTSTGARPPLAFNPSGGSVGVGISAPSATLHVIGTNIMSGASTHGSTLNIAGTLTAASTALISGATTVNSTFNVGGATNIVGATTILSSLNVSGTSGFQGNVGITNSNGPLMVFSDTTSGSWMGQFNTTSNTWLTGGIQGDMFIRASKSLLLGVNNNAQLPSIRLDSGGNVGIGTNAPSALLHVSGTTLIGGNMTANSSLTVGGAITLNSTLNVSGATFINGSVGLNSSTITQLTCNIGNCNMNGIVNSWVGSNMALFGSISNGTSPGLAIGFNPNTGPTSAGAGAWLYALAPGVAWYPMNFFANAYNFYSNTNMNLYSTVNITGATTLTSTLNVVGQTIINGNVGIGTTSPDWPLTVKGVMELIDTTQTQKYALYSDANVLQINPRTSAGAFNNINGLTMNNIGSVGIGMFSASTTLQVSGATILGGASTITSTLNVSGNTSIRGNVAIGNAAAVVPLDVNGSILARNYNIPGYQGAYMGWNRSGGTGEVNFMCQQGLGVGGFSFELWNNSNTFVSTLMYMNGSNNYVGINTANPSAMLDVNGTMLARGASTTNSTLYVAGAATMASTLNISGNTTIMGNLGVGMTTPNAAIGINLGSTNNLALALNSSGAGWGSGMQFINTTATTGRNYGLYAGSEGNFHIVDATNGADRMLISKDTGYIGINIQNPQAYLHVSGNSIINGATTAISTLFVGGAVTNNSTLNVAGNTVILGNMGIGTSNTEGNLFKVDAGLTTTSGISLGNYNISAVKYIGITPPTGMPTNINSSSGFSGITFGAPSDNAGSASTGPSGFIAFHTHNFGTSSNERMRIDKNGNVGINTNAPNAMMDVNGSVLARGAFTTNSTIYGGSTAIIAGATTMASTLSVSGNTVIMGTASVGSATAKGLIQAYNPSTSSQFNLALTGAEYYQPSSYTSADGVGLVLGVNRSGNRQLWIMDTALAANTTNTALRFNPNNGTIDSISTDGTTSKVLNISNGLGAIIYGSTTATSTMNISGITVMNNAATAVSTLFVGGATTIGSTLNVSGVFTAANQSILSGATTINSTLNVATSIGIGAVTTPTALLELRNITYVSPLLIIDAGVSGIAVGAPRGIGQPLMRLGKMSYSNTPGDYYGMSLGYAPNPTDYACTEIGTIITDKTGAEVGDIVFSTRPNNTNTVATERMRIQGSGNIGINTSAPSAALHVSGTSIINGATTTNSTLFIVGAITGVSSLNISGTSTLNTAIITGPVSVGSTLYVGNNMVVTGSSLLTGTATAASSLNVVGNLRVNNIYPYADTITSSTTLNETINIVGHYINIGNSNSIISILGTTTSVFTNEIIVEDPLIVVNSKASNVYNTLGNDAGIQIDAISSTGYLKTTTDGTKFALKAPQSTDIGYIVTKDNSDNLTITGTTTMKGAATIASTLNVSSTTILLGAVTTGSSLNVVGGVNATQLNANTVSSFAGSGLSIYAASNPMSFFVAGLNGMTLTNNGYLGIGTTSPANPLHVYNTTSGLGITVDSPAASTTQFQANSAGTQAWSIYRQANTTNLGVYMTTAGVNAMTILGSNAYVGLGTAAPSAMLHVTGTSIMGGASTHGSTLNVMGAVSMSSTLNISGTTSIMGNVGLGTTAPTHRLHIAGGNDSIRIGALGFTGTAADITTYGLERSRNQIIFSAYRDVMADKIGAKIVGINKQTYLDAPSNRVAIQSTDIAFFTVPPNAPNYDDTVERFRIMDTGNVGIGISGPSALLHVNGTSIISGAMTLSSTLNVVGAIAGSSTAIISGAMTNGSTLNVTGALAAASTSVLSGAVSANSSLNVSGTAYFSELQMNSITSGPAGLSTENSNILNLNLNFRPSGTVTTANVGGAFRIDGRNTSITPLYQWLYRPAGSSTEACLLTLNSSGNMALGTGLAGSAPTMLFVSGTSAFNSNGTFNSSLYVGGNITVASNLNVVGSINLASATIGGAATAVSSLNVSGVVVLSSAMTTNSTMYVAGATTMASTLNVSGNTSIMGYLGVGTTAPTSTLTVVGTNSDMVTAPFTAEFKNNGAFDGSTVVRINNNASSFGRTQLQLVGRFENNNDGWSLSTGRTNMLFQTQISSGSTITTNFALQNYGITRFGILSSYNVSVPALTITGNNNYVGIGIDTPAASLHVSGTTIIANAMTAASTLNVAGSIMGASASTFGSTLTVSGAMTACSSLNVSGTAIIYNNIAVGRSSARYTADIVGTANYPLSGAASQVIISDSVGSGLMNLSLGTNGTNNYAAIQSSLSGTSSMSLALNPAGGNVVIGMTSGSALLHVSGTTIIGGAMTAGSTLNIAGVATINNTTNIAGNMNVTGVTLFNNVSSDTWQTQVGINNNSSVASYQLLVGGSGNGSGAAGIGGFAIYGGLSGATNFRLNINTNGNVGIGKTDPQALLHVSGTTIIGGATTIASTLNVAGVMTAASTSILTGAVTALSTVNISGQTVINGMVGIGTNPTSAALHINNNVLRMGTLYEQVSTNFPEQIQWGNFSNMGYSNITAGMNGNTGANGLGGIMNLVTKIGNAASWNGLYLNNGNVGIGISSPSTMFHVTGNSLLQGTATVTSTLTVSGAMTSNSTLNVAGNTFIAGTMSIGTTANSYPLTISSATASKLALLEPSTSVNYITFSSNALVRGYMGFENSTGTGLFGSNSAYGMSIGTNSNGGVLALVTNNVIRTTIDTSGNMGIATASPSAVLHVNGTSILGGASTAGSTLNVAGALVAASTAVVSGAASTNSTLNVSGVATFNSNVIVGGSGISAFPLNVGGVGEQYSMTSSAKNIYFNSGTMVCIAPNTNVTNNSALLIDFSNSSTASGNTNAYIGGISGPVGNGPSHLVFGRRSGVTSWAESMRIDTSGNVGIGTTAPSASLHVSGTSIISGAMTSGSTLNTTGLLTAAGGLTSVGITNTSTMNVSGATNLNTAIVSGAMTLSSTLNTVGALTTAGSLYANNGISVSGTTILNSNTTIGSSLTVTGVVTAVSNMNVSGVLTANNSSVLVGITTLNSSLYVSGTSAFMNSIAIGTTSATGLLTLNGTSTSLLGPHINVFNTNNTYPIFQQLNWTSDNISQNYDMYYDGSVWKNSTSGWGYQLYKNSNRLDYRAYNSGAAGSTGSVLYVMTINGTSIGINNTAPAATLHVSGATILGGSATIQSTLNISGNTIMNTAATASSTLNVAGAFTVVGATVMNGSVSNTATLSVVGAITANSNLSVSGNTTIMGTTNVGTNGAKGLLQSYNPTGTSQYHLTLTGAEYYQPSNTSADGIGLTAGVNRTNNRQLWVMDTSLAINTTNVAFRIMPSQGAMDAVSTDGTVGKVFSIGNSAGVIMNGSGTVGSNLNVTSNMNVGGTSVLVGAVSNNSTLYNTGAVSMGSSLTVSGTSILTSAVSVGSTLSVTGAATMNSSLNVVGNMRVNNIYPYVDTVTSGTVLNETINIVGHYINIGNSNSIINIQGTTTSVFTNEIVVEDPLIIVNSKASGVYNTLGNDAGIQIDAISSTGYLKTTTDGTKFALKAPQSTNIGYIVTKDNNDNLTITGTTTMLGAATHVSTLNISGNTIMNTAATANSTMNIVGAMAAASTIVATGAVSMSSTLSVTGAVTSNSTMNVVGAFNAASTTVLTNATTVASTLNVSGAMTSASTLNVSGVTTLSNKVIFNPNIAQAPASIGQIDTSNTVNFINPAAAVTGVTLLAGTTTGQMFMCVNRSPFDVTLDSTDATAYVANSINTIIYAKTTVIFVWNATDAVWYPTRDTY